MDVYRAAKAFPSGEGGMPQGMTEEVCRQREFVEMLVKS